MVWLYIAILILILFIPIPLKLKVNYIHKKIQIFFYNKEIKFKEPKDESKKEKRKEKKKIKIHIIKDFINFLDKSSVKLNINLKIHIDIGIEDAANLAILYGVLSSLNYPLYRLISIVFNIRDFKLNITPCFNKTIFSFKSESIIYVTLAKLIYITLSVIKFYYLHRKDFEREVQLSNA